MATDDNSEELLEILWNELAGGEKKSCDGTALKRNPGFDRLVSKGYAEIAADRVSLTETGLREAQECVRRHRLAERLMADVFELRKEIVHETGCAFEHLLRKDLNESVCTLLGHPRFCPHGKPIPEGHCCREARAEVAKLILPLTEMEPNDKAQVAYLHMHDREALPKLAAMGILPGTEVVLLQRFPAFVLQIGKTQFAIDENLAAQVQMRRNGQTGKAKTGKWKLSLRKTKRGEKT